MIAFCFYVLHNVPALLVIQKETDNKKKNHIIYIFLLLLQELQRRKRMCLLFFHNLAVLNLQWLQMVTATAGFGEFELS